MVMWFNVKEARDQLLNEGEVVTLRPKPRKTGHEVLMFNGFGKKGDLSVEFLRELKEGERPADISIRYSGFKSWEDWQKAANGSKFLYYVRLVSLESQKKATE